MIGIPFCTFAHLSIILFRGFSTAPSPFSVFCCQFCSFWYMGVQILRTNSGRLRQFLLVIFVQGYIFSDSVIFLRDSSLFIFKIFTSIIYLFHCIFHSAGSRSLISLNILPLHIFAVVFLVFCTVDHFSFYRSFFKFFFLYIFVSFISGT